MYDVDQRLQELGVRLRRSGYRLTPQRLEVVRALVEDEHPSAEAVYQRISARLPTTSLATVYNTLDALRRLGEVLEIRPAQGPSRFDVRQPHRHPHLLCTQCGRVEDAHAVQEPAVDVAEPAAAGWRDLVVRLDLYGVCPACAGARS
ncbi:MAG: transcriptional repressor [Chloroflexota bacterium]|nr:transcriptional repressor [Chloroflexota bacterium]